jgi:hypothetical protein
MSEIRVNNLSNESSTGGPTITGITTFSGTNFFVPPVGNTAQRPQDPQKGALRFNTDTKHLEYYRGDDIGWSEIEASNDELGGGTGSNTGFGTRALFLNGFNGSGNQVNTIDYVTISTLGDAQDFGDSTYKAFQDGVCSSRTRSFTLGGSLAAGQTEDISTNVFSSLGNGVKFGELTDKNYGNKAVSDATRGISAGGEGPSPSAGMNMMEYITMASTGEAKDFGDLSGLRIGLFSTMNSTRGFFIGGRTASPGTVALHNNIDYVTIQTTGNATDFGDLYLAASSGGISGCVCNATRGFVVGGYNYPSNPYPAFNTIQYITTATLGNSQDFGDLVTARTGSGICSSPIRGVVAGGSAPSLTNSIEYFSIVTAGNALDFGDITEARRTVAGASNGHGGL